MWTPRVRHADLSLHEPFLFSELTLVERVNLPDTLSITGFWEDLRPAFDVSSGVVLWDDDGVQRFSGLRAPHPSPRVTKRGDGTATLNYASDLLRIWDKHIYPTPANVWTNQTTGYDTQTSVQETKLLGYITRNAGSTAYHVGADDRRVPHLRVPTSLGRGTSSQTNARFQNLGQVVTGLAELASLRVTIQQTYESGTPFLDVVVDSMPDYSAWARFGDATSGELGLLGADWSYEVGAPGATVVLSAAGGTLENRALSQLQSSGLESDWGRVEFFIDQRGTTDAGEITAGMTSAMAENVPTVSVSAPIAGGAFTFGPSGGSIPIGARVAVSLDGERIVDRIRELTTTVSMSEETVKTEPIFGSPDVGLGVTEKALRRALLRLRNLESQ